MHYTVLCLTLFLWVETISFFIFIIPSYFHLQTHTCITTDREWAGVVCLSHLLIRAVGVKNTPARSLCRSRVSGGATWNDKNTSAALSLSMKPCIVMCLYALYLLYVCVHIWVWMWNGRSELTNTKPAAHRVTLENKYISPPAPLVELWYQLAQHTILCSPLQSTGLSGLLNTNPAGY